MWTTLTISLTLKYSSAGASLHTLHDNDSWGLLPPEDVVNQYYNKLQIIGTSPYADRATFPIIPVHFLSPITVLVLISTIFVIANRMVFFHTGLFPSKPP